MCPVFRSSGRESHTARGKLHLLDVLGLGRASTEFVDIFSACLLCGACVSVCPRSINITEELLEARESFSACAGPHGYEKYLARKLLAMPGSLAGLRILGRTGEKLLGGYLPADSGLRLRLAMFKEQLPISLLQKTKSITSKQSDTVQSVNWFPGCAARYLDPDSLDACRSLSKMYGVKLNYPESLTCCGLADRVAGDSRGARKKARQNIQIFEETDGPVVVSCASCLAQLLYYPKLFAGDNSWQQRAEKLASRLVEFSTFFQEYEREKNADPQLPSSTIRVFYHQPCHLRHGDAPADHSVAYLQRNRNIEILDLHDGQRCCGQGGLFHVAHPDISGSIRDALVRDVLELQPDVITTNCSGCLMQWQQGLAVAGSDIRVLHIAQLLETIKAA